MNRWWKRSVEAEELELRWKIRDQKRKLRLAEGKLEMYRAMHTDCLKLLDAVHMQETEDRFRELGEAGVHLPQSYDLYRSQKTEDESQKPL